MVKGIGIDIIEIARVKEAVQKHGSTFLTKVFTKNELKYCRNKKAWRFPELAVRFAAKEAYAKAVGSGISGLGSSKRGLWWQDIEVSSNALGQPHLVIKGKLGKKSHLSLSHSRDYAVATVYVEN